MPAETAITDSVSKERSNVTANPSSLTQKAGLLVGRFRWVICGLLFLGVTKNYMDRQVLGVLKGPLQHELGWNDVDYGNLVFAFQGAYALGMIFMGRLIDRLGTRIGYAVAMVFWSIASMAHGAAHSFLTFAIARAALGFGEAGVFPASIKSVAEWFPKKERALATGIFNAGTNVGAILTPLFVPWVALHLGWRWAFLFTGALGFVWLALWLSLYRKPEEHPQCTVAEREYIKSDSVGAAGAIPWARLLRYRQTWAFARLANSRDLFDLRHRKHRRRLVIFRFDPPRVFRKCRKKVGNACLRDLRRANRDGLPRVRAMAGNPPDRTCRRGTPGIFGEPFHAGVGHLPLTSSRFCCWNWRNGRSGWRHAHRANRRARFAMDQQLHDSLFHCSIGLSSGGAFNSRAEPETRARANCAGVNS